VSDTGDLTGRGSPVLRGAITGGGTFAGGIFHTLPFLIPGYGPAIGADLAVVASEMVILAIASPGTWLNKVASRICFNQLGSARARRESYVGEWIPEPLPERAEWITGRSDGIPTGSPSTTRSAWPSLSCSNR
jgi:hypothetical protein